MTKDNNHLGKFELAYSHTEVSQIEISFDNDRDILSISAQDKSTGKSWY